MRRFQLSYRVVSEYLGKAPLHFNQTDLFKTSLQPDGLQKIQILPLPDSVPTYSRVGTSSTAVPFRSSLLHFVGGVQYFEVSILELEGRSLNRRFAIGFIGDASIYSRKYVGSNLHSECFRILMMSSDDGRCNMRSTEFSYLTSDTASLSEPIKCGDIVGAGMDHNDGSVFFTINGRICFSRTFNKWEGDWYPFISVLGLSGSMVLNLGEKSFAFDITRLAKWFA
eukprot:TRINITY_DN8179_c0_g1_i1.p1 TRINITY_DN8179_c0_g1~~TRINITY_DN8179_c0_g1_i1.p1  ORF type:complete len:225 (-),score=1.80 TRINITY_DN8179_c0_g1_i1:81-755(-)